MDTCYREELNRFETYWIGSLPNLLNVRLRHQRKGWRFEEDDAYKVKRVRDLQSDYVPNWLGHIGVRFYPDRESWRVQIQTDDRFRFLPGDGGPTTMRGWTQPGRFGRDRYIGDWDFSEGPAAVAARDKERSRLNQRQRERSLPEFTWTADLVYEEFEGETVESQKFYTRGYPILTPEAARFLSDEGALMAEQQPA